MSTETINSTEEITLTDLAEVLKSRGLDIRELAQQARELKSTPHTHIQNQLPHREKRDRV